MTNKNVQAFLAGVEQHQVRNMPQKDIARLLRTSTTIEEKYAIIKELIRQVKGISLFHAQLHTAYSLQNGRIAELPTGEGKTFSAVVAAICYVLAGHRVHILVFNDYLAKRDWRDNKEIYEICEMSVGFVDQHSSKEQRQEAYACDVVYVSAKQAGFDYLRDFLAMSVEDVIFPDFDVAIVDEADSIMIDECTTPLVLAGDKPLELHLTKDVDQCVQTLSPDDYEVDQIEQKVWLTDDGLDYAEKYLGLALYEEENEQVLCHLQNAMKAHFLLTKDKDYIVKDGVIQLVEETTGRITLSKRYPDLLHRAVEIKEKVELATLTMIYNSITMQHFLLLYKTLCGMTGTAVTSAYELRKSYGLEVDVMAPHVPSIRVDHEDAFFTEQEDCFRAILDQIQQCQGKGQPVLVGTKNVAESERFAELLENAGIAHCLLNAKNDEEEAKLIAKAGEPRRVTISTNMAGRGVDIRLGGTSQSRWREVVSTGGLFIISLGINSSERIDNQLRGRAGRQGDPGESKFFVWLNEEELSRRMTPLQKIKAEMGSSKKQTNTIRKIQRAMEVEAAETRFSLKRFSSVVEEQRRRLAEQRREILKGEHYFALLETANPGKYQEVFRIAGDEGIKLAEQQLTLYFISKHWALFLDALDDVRNWIHFMGMKNDSLMSLIGAGQNSVMREYVSIVFELLAQMTEDTKADIIDKMETLPITKDGINLQESGLQGGTSTWTYAIDESVTQFGTVNSVVKDIRGMFSGEEGILTNYYRRKYGKEN